MRNIFDLPSPRAVYFAHKGRAAERPRTARNPPGLLSVKLTEMEQGRFVARGRRKGIRARHDKEYIIG